MILSGQSSMAGLDPNTSFTPTVQNEFGREHVIVVRDAVGGQPIWRWYKDWKPAKGEAASQSGASIRPAPGIADHTAKHIAVIVLDNAFANPEEGS